MRCPNCFYDNPPHAQSCGNCGTSLTIPLDTTVPSPSRQTPSPTGRVEYAGFWLRVIATLIDGVLLAVPTLVLLFFDPSRLSSTLVAWAYAVLLIGLRGQTVGKMAVGIRVVNEHGEVPGLGPAALREIVGKFLSGLALGLGYLWVGWDSHKQGWHDKLAHTYVVMVRH